MKFLLSTVLCTLTVSTVLAQTSSNAIQLRLYDGNETAYIQSNLASAEEGIFKSPKFNASRNTVFIVHGYQASSDIPLVLLVARQFLLRGLNVISVDWRDMAYYGSTNVWEYLNSLINYPSAAANSRIVGEGLAALINKLHASNTLPISKTSCVGEGLGAQACGFLGRSLVAKIPIIIGLDPSGLLFGPFQIYRTVSRDDGLTVHLVHTDAGLLGTLIKEGTVSFLVNGGTRNQPGCNILDGSCSHLRSILYFIEAMERPTAFQAVKCRNLFEFVFRTCNSEPIYMGYPPNPNASGLYYLETNRQSPFGRGV